MSRPSPTCSNHCWRASASNRRRCAHAAFFAAFFIISYSHIVIGELAPKSWAIRKPELLSLWTAAPLYAFYWLMYPAIYLLNASANAILRIAGQGEPGMHHDHHYSREELR